MCLLAVAAAKAAPGVTTTAVALAAVWPSGRQALVAECDPAGGDLAARFGLPVEPGLVTVAAARRLAAGAIVEHTQPLPGGVRVLVGPAGAEQAAAALGLLPPGLLAGFDALPEVDVLADLGRLDPTSPALRVAGAARLVVLVARPTLAELQHLAHRIIALRGTVGRLGVVLAGAGPYPPGEVAAALGVEVLGTLPADARGAGVLGGVPASAGGVRRSPLVRAARTLADTLTARLAALPAPPAPPGSAPAGGGRPAAAPDGTRGAPR